MNKKYTMLGFLMLIVLLFAGCDDATIASQNNARASDNFEIDRRVVFFNGITDNYLLEITGKCSITADTMDNQLEVICKTGPGHYKKHYLGLSDNVAYFVEQLEDSEHSAYHYRVTFKPQSILPDIDFRGSVSDGPNNQE
jgi:hypothetical protein